MAWRTGGVGPTGPQGPQGEQGEQGPAGEDAAGGGFAAWDWAADAPALALADWADANTVGGDLALASLTQPASLGSGPIVGRANSNSADTRGFLRTVAAGDFVRAFRVGFQAVGLQSYDARTMSVAAVFVDHASDVDSGRWYGAGWRWNATAMTSTSGQFGLLTGNSAGNHWEAMTVSAGYVTGSALLLTSIMDVFLVRSGTSLHVYAGPPGAPVHLLETVTVSADAGLIGLRIDCQTDSLDLRGVLYAYRANLAAVPGI